VDALSARVREAAAVPEPQSGRGTETGGLLLGKRLERGKIRIEHFEEVTSEHRRGASFDLSPSDRVRMLKRVERKRSLDVLGYFRSHTRLGMYLDENDYTVARELFRKPTDVFLVVKPNGDAAPTAGFFYWRDGDIDRRETALPFPLDRGLLLTSGYRIALHPTTPAVVPTPIMQLKESTRWRTVAEAGATFAATAVLVPCLVFLGMGAWSRWHSEPAVVHSQSRPLRQPDPPPAEASAPAAVVPPPAPVQAPAASAPRRKRAPVRQAVILTVPQRSTAPIIIGKRREEDAAAIAAPALHPNGGYPSALKLRKVHPYVSLEPVRSSFLHRTVGHIPLIGRIEKNRHATSEEYVPPKPLKEMAPHVPSDLARDLATDLPVDLRIRVSKDGAVEETELLTKNVNPVFANLAVHAASHWDFEPARFHDRPISCDMVAHFHFRPE
jgi:outer membrane biosynthesis protein TonB